MKKIFFLSALLCASLMGFAINWNSYDWIGDGAGAGAYSNKYKIALAEGQAVVNIQQPGFATKPGIYTTVPAGISSCSLGEGNYAVQGAGIVLYLDAFTNQETEVTIVHGLGSCVCHVYYVDGTPSETPGKADPELVVNPKDTTIDASKSETFEISASKATDAGAITYVSDMPGIASVSDAGVVTAVGRGTAIITVSVAENETHEADSKKVTVTVTGPINWAALEWLGDGAGGGTYSSKYKLAAAYGQGVVNIQNKEVESVNHPGIYTTFPSVVTSCSLGAGNYATQDAGMWLFLSAFTKMETDVTVTCGTTDYNFTVYYVGGTTAIDNTNANVNAIKVIENGQLIIIKNGVRYNALGAEVH